MDGFALERIATQALAARGRDRDDFDRRRRRRLDGGRRERRRLRRDADFLRRFLFAALGHHFRSVNFFATPGGNGRHGAIATRVAAAVAAAEKAAQTFQEAAAITGVVATRVGMVMMTSLLTAG